MIRKKLYEFDDFLNEKCLKVESDYYYLNLSEVKDEKKIVVFDYHDKTIVDFKIIQENAILSKIDEEFIYKPSKYLKMFFNKESFDKITIYKVLDGEGDYYYITEEDIL